MICRTCLARRAGPTQRRRVLRSVWVAVRPNAGLVAIAYLFMTVVQSAIGGPHALGMPVEAVWSIQLDAALAGAALSEDEAGDGEAEAPSPIHIARDAEGNVTLTVNSDVQSRIGLTVETLETVSFQPRVTAYGMLEADPSRSCTLHAPVSGFLRDASSDGWPGLGSNTPPGAVLGHVEPRFTASETVDLATRWTEALSEVAQLNAQLIASRASYENKKKLNANGGLVSDRQVEEAEATLKGDEARLQAAQKNADMIEGLLNGNNGSKMAFQLKSPCDGEVVEVMASIGEAVESGQPLLRLARFDRLIARVSVMPGMPIPASNATAQIIVLGEDDVALAGEPMGLAASRDATTRGPTLLFHVKPKSNSPVRPGAPLVAYVVLGGEAHTGVSIPRSAVIRLGGLTWIYVQTSPDDFERRQVELRYPDVAGWFSTSGAHEGDQVVTSGAQLLLSEEQKLQIESEEEASE